MRPVKIKSESTIWVVVVTTILIVLATLVIFHYSVRNIDQQLDKIRYHETK